MNYRTLRWIASINGDVAELDLPTLKKPEDFTQKVISPQSNTYAEPNVQRENTELEIYLL